MMFIALDGTPYTDLREDGNPADGFAVLDEQVPCKCHAEKVRRNRVRSLGEDFPRGMEHLALDRNPIAEMPEEHVEPVRKYVDALEGNVAEGRGLWLTGPPGTGKTSLAAVVCLRAVERNLNARFFRMSRLLSRIRIDAYQDEAGMSDNEWAVRLGHLDVLVLDDLGAEKSTTWSVKTITDILDMRESERKPVVVTTNLSDDELELQIGARAVSRLYGVTGEKVEVSGPDHRRAQWAQAA